MIEDYRLARWQIARVPRFASQLFAHRYVIIPAANKAIKSRRVHSPTIVRRLKQAHRNWFMRIKELVLRELWSPGSEFSGSGIQKASVARCLYCRPTSLEYHWPANAVAIKPCGKFGFCPFCSARQAEELYRRVSRSLRQLQKQSRTALVTCRIETYVIKTTNFEGAGWDKPHMLANAKVIHAALQREIANYKKISRKLGTDTFGSMWRVVLNPADTGCEIQVRQLFITRPKAKRPVNRAKKSSAIFLQSAKATDFKAVMNVFGLFVEYPRGMLIGYAELVAAVMHARNSLRLHNATGCAYRRSRIEKPEKEQRFLPDVP
jgi:hypothetical protein